MKLRSLLAIAALASAVTACAQEKDATTAPTTSSAPVASSPILTSPSPADTGAAGAAPSDSAGTSALPASCTKDSLATRTKGTLTIGTDSPGLRPVVRRRRPDQRQGLRVRGRLRGRQAARLRQDQVNWVKVPFNSSYAPGREEVRLRHQPDLDHRRRATKVVDFSDGYYAAAQAVDRAEGLARPPAPTALAELKGLKLGAQTGTTSLTAITDVIKPEPAAAGLRRHQRTPSRRCSTARSTAILVDLPTAFYITAAEIPDGQDRRPVPAGDRPAGAVRDALREGQRAGALRRPGAGRAARRRHAGGAREAVARPTSSSVPVLQVSRRTCVSDGSRAPRQRERLRVARRLRRRSTRRRRRDPAVVVLAPARRAGDRAPGWPRVRETFFDWPDAPRRLPAILRRASGSTSGCSWSPSRLILVFGLAGRGRCGRCAAPVLLPGAVARGASTPTCSAACRRCSWSSCVGFGRARAAGCRASRPACSGWACVALVLSYGAYVAEVFRAGHRVGAPVAACASAAALGLSHGQTMRLRGACRRRCAASCRRCSTTSSRCRRTPRSVASVGLVDALAGRGIHASCTSTSRPTSWPRLLFVALTIPLARLTDWVGGAGLERAPRARRASV